MAVLSPEQIKKLWVDAGGNPQQAGRAAELAIAASGGNPDFQRVNADGTIDRGLWGINSTYGKQASIDPMENARAAVAVSSNGTDWDPWGWLADKLGWLHDKLSGQQAENRSAVAELLGIDNLPKFAWHSLMVGAGAAWMIIGLLLLVFGSRRFASVARFVTETVGGGFGFGVGARVSGGLEEAVFGGRTSPEPPGPSPAPGPGPVRPALPSGPGDAPTRELPRVLPSIQPASGRSAQRRTYRVKLRQTVASGGPTHKPSSGAGPFPRRERGFNPLAGDFPGGPYRAKHRAED